MRGGGRRVATCGAALVVGVLLAPAAAAGAQGGAEPGGVALSVDGRRWTTDLEAALFGSAPWTPGETRRAVLLVRNDGPGPAGSRVAVSVGEGVTGRGASALADAVRVRVRPEGGRWSDGAGSAPVLLAESEVLPVTVEASLDGAAGNETQGETVPVDVLVTLAGDGPPDTADTGGEQDVGRGPADDVRDGPGALARTGGQPLPALLAAVVAVAAGVLLRRGRARGGGHRG
ncbi:hypothetical protein [Isoptericola sp. NPDC060257]|uniref:hypothetical protein n=1 Tax=Isoptericola sp. NPDC060257 TaxID=3347087 RepID=UPI00365C2FA3